MDAAEEIDLGLRDDLFLGFKNRRQPTEQSHVNKTVLIESYFFAEHSQVKTAYIWM